MRLCSACPVLIALVLGPTAMAGPLDWPDATRQCRPWAYHWWLGSAVDKENLSKDVFEIVSKKLDQ